MDEEKTHFEILFRKDDLEATVSMRGCTTVEVCLEDGRKERVDYSRYEIAIIAFEENVKYFENNGYTSTIHCGDDIPGVLEIAETMNADDDRIYIKWDGNRLVSICVFEADPIGVWDGWGLNFGIREKGIGHFDDPSNPRSFDPLVRGLHLLRRFLAHPGIHSCQEFILQAAMKQELFLDMIAKSSKAHLLTHLEPYGLPKYTSKTGPILFGEQFPSLVKMSISDYSYLQTPLSRLKWLRLGWGAVRVAGLQKVIDTIFNNCPVLEILEMPPPYKSNPDYSLETILNHPLMNRIKILDLHGSDGCENFDFNMLLTKRPQLNHLQKIIVGKHMLADEIIEGFNDWPTVVFAAFDREEIKDHDAMWAPNYIEFN